MTKNAHFDKQTSFIAKNSLQTAYPLFSLMSASGKEKSLQKRNRVWGSFALCGARQEALPLDSASL